MKYYELIVSARDAEVLALMLGERRRQPAGTLSGGQLARVSLASALQAVVSLRLVPRAVRLPLGRRFLLGLRVAVRQLPPPGGG